MGSSDKKVEAIAAASLNHDGADIAATLSSLSLSGNKMSNVETEAQNHVYQNFGDQTDVLFNVPKEHRQFSQQSLAQNTDEDSLNAPEYSVFPNGGSNFSNLHVSKLASHSNSKFSMQSPHSNANKKGSLMSSAGSISHYQNLNCDSPGIDISGRHMKTHAGGFTSSMLSNQLTPGTLNPFPHLFLYACLSVMSFIHSPFGLFFHVQMRTMATFFRTMGDPVFRANRRRQCMRNICRQTLIPPLVQLQA
jgi:pumilio RNA-binding family